MSSTSSVRAASCAWPGRRECVRAVCMCTHRGLCGGHYAFRKRPHGLICELCLSFQIPTPYHLFVLICARRLPGAFPKSYTWQVMDRLRNSPRSAMLFSPLIHLQPLYEIQPPCCGRCKSFLSYTGPSWFLRDSQMYFYLLSPKTQGLCQPLEETC